MLDIHPLGRFKLARAHIYSAPHLQNHDGNISYREFIDAVERHSVTSVTCTETATPTTLHGTELKAALLFQKLHRGIQTRAVLSWRQQKEEQKLKTEADAAAAEAAGVCVCVCVCMYVWVSKFRGRR